jgi:hypothetical protein
MITVQDIAAIRGTMVGIARGFRECDGQRLTRAEIDLAVRDLCDHLGWPYYPVRPGKATDAANRGSDGI